MTISEANGGRLPLMSVVIATFNRAIHFRATFDQIRSQSVEDIEIIVIDQSCEGEARQNKAWISDAGDLRCIYIHVANPGLPNARNVALALVKANVVVFVDDDILLTSNKFLKTHLDAYSDESVGGVTGRHVERFVKMNSRRTACYVAASGRTIFNLFGTERQEIGSCKGSNMSYRMAAVRQIGGFDRHTHMLEDTDFSYRIRKAGWRLMFEPDAEVIHLSAPAGGVRERGLLGTQKRRFSSTGYFVGKHRGAIGISYFLFVFGLIAVRKAASVRSISAFYVLMDAAISGIRKGKAGPDQLLRFET